MMKLDNLYHQKIRPLFDSKVVNQSKIGGPEIVVLTTNKCNLSCYGCSAHCSVKNTFSEIPTMLTPQVLDQFLTNITGFQPDRAVQLQGGEVTTIPLKIVEKYTKVVREHGRKAHVLTNGYRMDQIDPHLFDRIVLDEHAQNRGDIKKAVAHFINEGYDNYFVYVSRYHINLEKVVKSSDYAPEFVCKNWYNSVTLYDSVVYPCCLAPMIHGYTGNDLYRLDLIVEGYTYNNPNLANLLNAKQGPVSMVKTCTRDCYRRRNRSGFEWKRTDAQ